MERSDPKSQPSDWVAAQLRGTVPATPGAEADRRGRPDRRRRVLWALLYGSFNPRRRSSPRRLDDSRFQAVDWHSAHLLAVSIGILMLSVADAFMTVTLLSQGAVEVNPFMAAFVYRSAAGFAAAKMTMTGVGVMCMVVLARYRFLRIVRVDVVMYVLLVGYLILLGYEFWLLQVMLAPP